MGSMLSKVFCCVYCRQKNETKEDTSEISTKQEADNEAFDTEEKEPCEKPVIENKYEEPRRKTNISRHPLSFSYHVRTEAIREVKLRKSARNAPFFDAQNKTEEEFPRLSSKRPIPYNDAIVEENTLNSVKLRKTGQFFCVFDG